MEVEFLRSFEKDLSKVDLGTRKKVLRIVLALEEAGSLGELHPIKKLSGYKDAYRVRIGEYRLGLYLMGDKVQLARLLHRKELYRFFP
jgi:mRNA-degrading endonuclease RelE of RelBE toxin-antitoxin system